MGDEPRGIAAFRRAFRERDCTTEHIGLFQRTHDDLAAVLATANVVWVGGGNTASLLAVWRAHGVDEALRAAYTRGAVLTGGSAGGICWFEGGVTDSFGPTLRPLADGLGIIAGSFCPHYDSDDQRRRVYPAAVATGVLSNGWAVGERDGVHFYDGRFVEAVTSSDTPSVFRVERDGEAAVETATPARRLS
jgi:peptidase E